MITYYPEIIQGSDEWLAARCGILTASEMKLIVTPGLKPASNDKERSHLYELLAQRITRYVEPHYISDDMLRGQEDEILARALYNEHYEPVTEAGFVTSDKYGFTIGYSPDGLVGDNGLIEIKSRRQKFQIETAIEYYPSGAIPGDYLLQCQTGLLVTERDWIDFISYSGGLPMVVIREYPDEVIQTAIVEAAAAFEKKLTDKLYRYRTVVAVAGWLDTERRVEQEIVI